MDNASPSSLLVVYIMHVHRLFSQEEQPFGVHTGTIAI